MRDGPQTESHFTRNQNVLIIKQVHIPPGQRTVLLTDRQVRQTGGETDRQTGEREACYFSSFFVGLCFLVSFLSYLLSSFPSLYRTDRQAESGRAREISQVDIIGQPLVPPAARPTGREGERQVTYRDSGSVTQVVRNKHEEGQVVKKKLW